jgi:hypothetical protein
MEWLETNWLPLLIVILVILGFIGWIIYLIKRKGLRQVALDAILEAEREFQSGKGKEKMKFAVDYVFDLLPLYIKAILPREFLHNFLEKFIQKVFDEVKKFLDYTEEQIQMLKKGGIK